MPRGRRMSEERILTIAATRHCNYCGKQLVRRDGEPVDMWLKRRNCNRECGVAGRAPRQYGLRKGPSEIAPVVQERPTRDRCWAGFAAGRRCVLSRGSHVTHRDEAGREFVRVERRPVERIERNVSTSGTVEYLGMRSEWRSVGRS